MDSYSARQMRSFLLSEAAHPRRIPIRFLPHVKSHADAGALWWLEEMWSLKEGISGRQSNRDLPHIENPRRVLSERQFRNGR